MGTVSLLGMEFFAFHGVTAIENKIGRTFIVDVVAKLNYEQAAIDQDVSKTLDYAQIYKLSKKQMAIATPLLETVARNIALEIWNLGIDLEELEVVIYKVAPFIGGKTNAARVSYCLNKNDL